MKKSIILISLKPFSNNVAQRSYWIIIQTKLLTAFSYKKTPQNKRLLKIGWNIGQKLVNPIQDGGGGQKGPLPVFPL